MSSHSANEYLLTAQVGVPFAEELETHSRELVTKEPRTCYRLACAGLLGSQAHKLRAQHSIVNARDAWEGMQETFRLKCISPLQFALDSTTSTAAQVLGCLEACQRVD
jgi:hypothetical protein